MSDWLLRESDNGIVNAVTGVSIEWAFRACKHRWIVRTDSGDSGRDVDTAEALAFLRDKGFDAVDNKVVRAASAPAITQPYVCYDAEGNGYSKEQWLDCFATWQLKTLAVDVHTMTSGGLSVAVYNQRNMRAEEERQTLYEAFCAATTRWYYNYCAIPKNKE